MNRLNEVKEKDLKNAKRRWNETSLAQAVLTSQKSVSLLHSSNKRCGFAASVIKRKIQVSDDTSDFSVNGL